MHGEARGVGRPRSQRGAALVELAVILPLFVLLIFGMIEAGWAFAQANDVRHGAREGRRRREEC
jgi:Flp pilus assembly protein TadG